MHVLVDTKRSTYHDIVEEPFPVAPPLEWREAPRGLNRDWTFDGDTFTPPTARTLNEARAESLAKITMARDAMLSTLTVVVNGANYDANEESHARIERAISAWQRAVQAGDPRAPQNVEWLDADNIPRRLTLEQLMEVSAAIWLKQEASVWARNTVLKSRIEKATSVEAVDSVRWDDG